MEPSFEKLLVLLADADVRFVLVGGLAVSMQGYVRFTEDVDMLIDSEAENITNLLDTLANYGEGFARELTPEDFTDEEGAIRIVEETEQCQIDIFTRMSGLRYRDLASQADTFKIANRTILCASKPSLIALKDTSHREKDKLDAQALKELQQNPKAFD
jgi:hypothetical protein